MSALQLDEAMVDATWKLVRENAEPALRPPIASQPVSKHLNLEAAAADNATLGDDGGMTFHPIRGIRPQRTASRNALWMMAARREGGLVVRSAQGADRRRRRLGCAAVDWPRRECRRRPDAGYGQSSEPDRFADGYSADASDDRRTDRRTDRRAHASTTAEAETDRD
jgi:hypothetical protein